MLVAPGGGGGTDWTSMDVPHMWELIANQDTSAHYELLTGWQRSYELILEHLGQIQNYRQNLAAAWPPEKSSASAAYVAQLDNMISHLQKTYDAAIANHTAVAGATLSLSLSRDDLKKIYDEYTSNQQKLDEFNAKPKQTPYARVPLAPPKPPVAPSRQQELVTQARVLMSKLSTDLAQSQASLTSPAEFAPPLLVDKDKKTLGDGGPAPVIPVGSSTDEGASHHSSGSGVGSPSASNAGLSGSGSTAAPANGSRPPGLVLGGTNPTQISPATPITTPGSGSPMPPAAGLLQSPINQPSFLAPSISTNPHLEMPIPGSGQVPLGRGMAASAMTPEHAPSMRATPPGGIIGNIPGGGMNSAAGQRGLPQRVNPVGGVIGNGAQQPGVGSKSGTGQQLSSVNSRAGRRKTGDPLNQWDPDNPWETNIGVAPVVLPVSEQPIDPGPAIGLD